MMMKRLRTDAGAIKFVLSGANIMCPGLTHPDAVIHDEAEKGEPVAIFAAGKEHAMAVGEWPIPASGTLAVVPLLMPPPPLPPRGDDDVYGRGPQHQQGARGPDTALPCRRPLEAADHVTGAASRR